MTAAGRSTSPGPLANRDFRWLWSGQAVSVLGDQFALIALPWLALIITGSPLALGSVLAVMAIPRAVLMLLGGASVDRWSPRRVMVASNAVRLGAVTILALVVLSGGVQAWMLYAFGLAFGVADAFFYPAVSSMLPSLLAPEQLSRGNALYQGTNRTQHLSRTGRGGPRYRRLGIGCGRRSDDRSRRGAAHRRRELPRLPGNARADPSEDWHVGGRRAGPGGDPRRDCVCLRVAQPASRRPARGQRKSAHRRAAQRWPARPRLQPTRGWGGRLRLASVGYGRRGSLGIIAAGVLPTPRPSRYGPFVVALMALIGAGMIGMAFAPSIAAAVAITVAIGLSLGYANLSLITWSPATRSEGVHGPGHEPAPTRLVRCGARLITDRGRGDGRQPERAAHRRRRPDDRDHPRRRHHPRGAPNGPRSPWLPWRADRHCSPAWSGPRARSASAAASSRAFVVP